MQHMHTLTRSTKIPEYVTAHLKPSSIYNMWIKLLGSSFKRFFKKKSSEKNTPHITYVIQGKHEINIKSQEMTLKIRVKLISECHFSDVLRSDYQEFKSAFHKTESQLPLLDSQI